MWVARHERVGVVYENGAICHAGAVCMGMGRRWIQWVALQATWLGVRLGSGDNRLAPIGPGYS
jgi:hypothetical protein